MKRIDPRINKNFKNRFGTVYFLQFLFGNFKRKFFMGFKHFKNNYWGEKWLFINIEKFLNAFKKTTNVQSSETQVEYTQNIAFGVASFHFVKTKTKKFFSYFVQNNLENQNSVIFSNLVSKISNRIAKKTEIAQTIVLQKIFNLT